MFVDVDSFSSPRSTLQEIQSSSLERLIAWLLDHTNIEVPDLESNTKDTPPLPLPPPAQPPMITNDASEERGDAVMVYESSSDSSGSSVLCLSTVSLSLADDKSFKSREDFSSGDEYMPAM